jgi:CPA1 family monovalent cation:H+ antiporter
MQLEIKILWMILIAAGVAMLVKKIRLPYTVALVFVGLFLGTFHIIEGVHLTPELLLAVFLPVLLFEAAYHIHIDDFRRNVLPIVLLALPGLLLGILLTAALTYMGFQAIAIPISFGAVFLFASLIAATDPISVLALFKEMGAPRRLSMIMEGESLFNDGAAVVIFAVALDVVLGQTQGVGQGVREFIFEVGGGVGVGLLVGFIFSLLTAQIEDHLIEITLTTICAYGSYLLADQLHFSGVIAVVAAGMLSGNFGTRFGMSPSTRLEVTSFWEYAAFIVNSVIFLLIGIEVKVATLWQYALPILLAWIILNLARTAMVAVSWVTMKPAGVRLPAKWLPVMVWGGIRGALAMMLALSLPKEMPFRELILALTFGVVILSILGQGLSIGKLLKWLGLSRKTDEAVRLDEVRGKAIVLASAIEELKRLRDEKLVSNEVYQRLEEDYQNEICKADENVCNLLNIDENLKAEAESNTRRHLLEVQKDTLLSLVKKGLISSEAARSLLLEIDSMLEEMGR